MSVVISHKNTKFNTTSYLDCIAVYQINYFTFTKKSNFHKFLNDIRSTVGDDIFAKFLNLKTERSLAFVIDVSGSMSGEPHFAHLTKVNSVILRFSWKPLHQKSGKPRFYQQGQLKPIFKKKMQISNFFFFPYLIASFFYFISLFFCLFFFSYHYYF